MFQALVAGSLRLIVAADRTRVHHFPTTNSSTRPHSLEQIWLLLEPKGLPPRRHHPCRAAQTTVQRSLASFLPNCSGSFRLELWHTSKFCCCSSTFYDYLLFQHMQHGWKVHIPSYYLATANASRSILSIYDLHGQLDRCRICWPCTVGVTAT